MTAKFMPTEEQRYSVSLMASIGIPQKSIALALTISEPTLLKNFSEELKTGRVRTIAKVADSLVRQALAGNMTAAIFYLKTQAGWKESQAIEISGGGTVNLDVRKMSAVTLKEILDARREDKS